MEWLTADTGPWWATAVISGITFVLGNFLSNRSSERQRRGEERVGAAERTHQQKLAELQHNADQAERDAARRHELAQADAGRLHESEQLAAQARAAEERERGLRDAAVRNEVQLAIGAMRAALVQSAAGALGEPIDPGLLARLTVALTEHARVFGEPVGHRLDDLLRKLEQSIMDWPDSNYAERENHAFPIVNLLGEWSREFADVPYV